MLYSVSFIHYNCEEGEYTSLWFCELLRYSKPYIIIDVCLIVYLFKKYLCGEEFKNNKLDRRE